MHALVQQDGSLTSGYTTIVGLGITLSRRTHGLMKALPLSLLSCTT